MITESISTAEPGMTQRLPRSQSHWRRAGLRLVGCGVLFSLLLGVGYATRNFWSPKRFGVVIPGTMYRSGQISRFVLERTLRHHGIRTIVDLTKREPQNSDQTCELQVTQQAGISHHRFGLDGNGTGDLQLFVGALTTLEDCRRRQLPVLVHCAAGAQRTGAVVAAYRLLFDGKSPREIVEEMERYGFSSQRHQDLLHYLDRNLPEIASRLHAAGVLSHKPQVFPKLASAR